jgi:uncharacterized membrane protein YccC
LAVKQHRAIAFEAGLIDVARGLRAALATVLPFYLASATGHGEFAWAAIGGWLGTLVDPGGSRLTRFRTIAAFAMLGAVGLALAELVAEHLWLATLLLGGVAFFACVLRALGASAAVFGTLLTIVVAIGEFRPSDAPVQNALYFAAGAGWATLLSTVLWPVWIHLPVSRAVGRVFAEMATYARALLAHIAHIDALQPEDVWVALARGHPRRIRQAIEEARKVAMGFRARRSGQSRVGGNLIALLGLAEAQFPLLITLAEDIVAMGACERVIAKRALESLQLRYETVRAALVTVVVSSLTRAPEMGDPERPRTPSPIDLIVERLLRASGVAVTLAVSLDADHGAREKEPSARRSLVRNARDALVDSARTLRDAFSLRSLYLRHALRVTVAVVGASLLGRGLGAPQPHWITVTTLVALQPFPGATWERTSERVVGTVFGCAVAAAITLLVRSPVLLVALIFPLSVIAVATRPHSYRLFTFFVTPVFVLIAERFPGDWWTAVTRAGSAMVGGAIALIAALVILPSWEQKRLPDALAQMLAATSAYCAGIFGRLDQAKSEDDATTSARRRCGVALNEAEAALDRWFAEPIGKRAGREDAARLVTYTRRLTGALTALSVHVHDSMLTPELRAQLAGDRSVQEIRTYALSSLERASVFVRCGNRAPRSLGPAPPKVEPHLDVHLRFRLDCVVAQAAILRTIVGVALEPSRRSVSGLKRRTTPRRHVPLRRGQTAAHKAIGVRSRRS